MVNVKKMATLGRAALSTRSIFTLLSQNCKYVIPSASASSKNYSTAAENVENYDVIIAGGGMVGATLACAIG